MQERGPKNRRSQHARRGVKCLRSIGDNTCDHRWCFCCSYCFCVRHVFPQAVENLLRGPNKQKVAAQEDLPKVQANLGQSNTRPESISSVSDECCRTWTVRFVDSVRHSIHAHTLTWFQLSHVRRTLLLVQLFSVSEHGINRPLVIYFLLHERSHAPLAAQTGEG